ncbi:MAG: Rab family GTPase [Thermoplasmata archaeon]
MSSKHITKKVVLLGDSAVGKTSLVRKYVIDVFDDKYIATIGTKVLKKDIEYKLPTRTIFLTLMIWDILGQKDFKSVRTTGLRGADAAILVCDLTRPESISSVSEFWYPQVEAMEGDVPKIVIGNKVDLVSDIEEAKSKLQLVATEVGGPYFLCSAKTGENVERAFLSVGELLIGKTSEQIGDLADEELTLTRALDYLMSDFCDQSGDLSKGMESLEKMFSKAKLDINAPSKDSLFELIELMSEIEKDRLGREVAEVNKLRRWKVLEELEHHGE